MQEESFGPVLPVVAVDDVDAAIRFVNERPKPLALYVFSGSTADRVLRETSSGGACIDDVVSQVFVSQLPFGGVGESGMGAYHGRWGFELFSHRRAVLDRPTWFEMPMLLPPYSKLKERITRWVF
ncbi:MAG: aldehyde dehydrogenase family protein [Acidimicrobiales bacterium]